MWQTVNRLKLNGISFTKAELQLNAALKLRDNAIEPWERRLFEFIHEWLNDEQFVVVKTSGSTGKPKQISIDKNKMVASAQLTADYLQLTANDSALLCLSAEYIAGKMMVVRAMLTGMNLIAVEPSSMPLKNVLHQQIDFAAFVPMQLFMMLDDALYSNKLQQIKSIIIGGSEVSFSVKEKVRAFDNNIYETFGMTETVSHIALKLISQKSKQDYFETLGNITVTTDNENRLVIHAPHFQSDPIITNDVIELLNEEQFRWLGRLDNVVNSGGVKLFPESIEQKLKPHLLNKFFLAGMPNETLGQQLVMFIESEKRLDSETILDNAKLFLQPYEVPKHIIQMPRFAETANGKINRKETIKQIVS
jgi:O-succinylbenzoic acid--CoA ligase